MVLEGTPDFPAAPRQLPQWCDISAGPLENPMIQCLLPPHLTAEDVPLGTGVEGQQLNGWLPLLWSQWKGKGLPNWKEGKMPQLSSLPHNSHCQSQWVAGTALAGRTPGFQGSWHTRSVRAGCSQVLAHLHPAPHHSALIKVIFAPLFDLQVFKVQHLIKSLCLAKQDLWTMWRVCFHLCCLRNLISFWFTRNICS